ncbi:MAG: putative Ig domain-containing protein, partial [Planctomycetales bacterium]
SSDIGNHSIVVRAEDGRGGATEQTFTLAVMTPPPNRPPVITSTPKVSANIGTEYEYAVAATDHDGDTLSYSFSRTEYEEVVIDDDPVGYWRLGDTLSAVATDSSGNNLHGQYVGLPSLGIVGALAENTDSAARFAGGPFVTVADRPALRPSQITLEAWVRPASPPAFRSIVMKSSNGNWLDGYGLAAYYYGNNDIHFFVNNSSSGEVSGIIPLDTWSHVVGTYDGRHLRLFVNGVLTGEAPYNEAIAHSTAPLRIGSGAGDFHWNGDLDEVAIYDSALSADQVLEHFELGRNGPRGVDSPHGMTIDESTGVISWTPAGAQVGLHKVIFDVTDGRGGTASQSYVVQVDRAAGNRAPMIVSRPPTSLRLGENLRYVIEVADADGETATVSLLDSPHDARLPLDEPIVTWWPTEVGLFTFEIVADDGAGGLAKQRFIIEVIEPAGGAIRGTKFLSKRLPWDSSEELGLTPADVVIHPDFESLYSAYKLGPVPGVPNPYGGLTLKFDDPNVLLIGGSANRESGQLYAVDVIRGPGGHITGFADTARVVSDAAYNDGGIVYGPDGVLFFSQWPVNGLGQIAPGSSTTNKVVSLAPYGVGGGGPGGLAFVPPGIPGAGQLKLASWPGGLWYTIDIAPDGSGTFDVTGATQHAPIFGGPEGIQYVPIVSPGFSSPAVLVANFGAFSGNVAAYNVDANGDPIPETGIEFIHGLRGAEGAFLDPYTGDLLVSTHANISEVYVVHGFTPPLSIGAGLAGFVIYLDQDEDGSRDQDEPFAVTDEYGHYEFTDLTPGSYIVREEYQAGFVQTFPDTGSHLITIQGEEILSSIHFMNEFVGVSPEIRSTAPTHATVGELYRYPVSAAAAGFESQLSFSLTVAPNGMAVTSDTGIVAWQPDADQLGTQDVILRVEDGLGGFALQAFQITVEAANVAPVITSSPPAVAVIGETFSYSVLAQDADEDSLTYRLDLAPAGMVIDSATGVISWTPEPVGGPWSVLVRVEDGRGGFDEQSFSLGLTDPVVDLTISNVDQSGLVFDGQRLTVAGPISARVTNLGSLDITTPFRVTFFEDRNGNNTFEPQTDNILGSDTVASPLTAGESNNVSAILTGSALFTNNRIWAIVDSESVIPES